MCARLDNSLRYCSRPQASLAGDYVNAEAMYQRALGLGEKGLGPDHSRLGHLNDLTMVYCTTGDYGKGESLSRRAISIDERKR